MFRTNLALNRRRRTWEQSYSVFNELSENGQEMIPFLRAKKPPRFAENRKELFQKHPGFLSALVLTRWMQAENTRFDAS